MLTATLSSKGQVVLPASVRTRRRWHSGVRFEVVETADGVLLRPVAPVGLFAPTTLDDVFGKAGYSGPALSVGQMDAAVAVLAASQRK